MTQHEDDLGQEACVKHLAWRARNPSREIKSPAAWAAWVVQSTLKGFLRKEAIRKENRSRKRNEIIEGTDFIFESQEDISGGSDDIDPNDPSADTRRAS